MRGGCTQSLAMSLRRSSFVACALVLCGCGASVTGVPDGAIADSSVADHQQAADVAVDRDAGIAFDSGIDATSAPDAAVDAPMDAPSPDARADAADAMSDAGSPPASDACVADGGDPSLRFGAVYRQTMNDGRGEGCTTSSRCHGRPGEFFDLSSESAAYASLLGVMGSCGVRVTPCDLSASYLSRLMHNPDTCRGMRHTGFGQTMTPEQVALVDAWILGGAQR